MHVFIFTVEPPAQLSHCSAVTALHRLIEMWKTPVLTCVNGKIDHVHFINDYTIDTEQNVLGLKILWKQNYIITGIITVIPVSFLLKDQID